MANPTALRHQVTNLAISPIPGLICFSRLSWREISTYASKGDISATLQASSRVTVSVIPEGSSTPIV